MHLVYIHSFYNEFKKEFIVLLVTSNYKKLQISRDENPHNKLFQIQPILKERKLDPNNTNREETTITRLRIGHTRLTHSFIVKEEPPPKCPCGN